MKSFQEVFKTPKPVIGVLHLKGGSKEDVQERAKKEIEAYLEGGADALLAEDYFGTYDDLEWVLGYLQDHKPGVPVGVNCLNFDSLNYLLARKYSCDFLQLDSVVGHVKPRDEASLSAFFSLENPRTDALVLGGVRFKYQPVLSEKSLAEDIETAKKRCGAICVTGDGTGQQTPLEKLQEFRKLAGSFPLVICSGLNDENCVEQLKVADAAVVGSYFKDSGKDTGDVDAAKVKKLMDKVKTLRP
ncbi:MAG: membrane biogenesis protein [Firmicutes bacterium]|nr:membrane biogenesis protein [Bacillota bacterium]